jgi:hypothetical protein
VNATYLKIEEIDSDNAEPRVSFVLMQGEKEVLRRDARVFCEDDIIYASNQIVKAGDLNSTDVDQYMAELVESIRNKWLRSREQPQAENAGTEAENPKKEEINAVPPRYIAVLPDEGQQEQEASIRDAIGNRVLTNFVLELDEDVEVQDDIEAQREFAGKLTVFGRTVPFRIGAKDFADNGELKAALFNAGGCELVIHCSMDELRRAITMISNAVGQVRRRKLTTNFGWTSGEDSYLTPSLRISQGGIEVLDETAEIRVALGSEMPACYLDMKKLSPDELLRVKRHVVEDLLTLNDRMVTHTLLGAAATAVLYPFATGAGRFALWLVGRTGAGKSFCAKLFSNFFGNFPVSSAPITSWSATPNYIQRQGYFFKDALYLVDDYKPEVVLPYQVVRVLQTYSDGTARGRLKSDATANVLRPIRGLLVCTGEDVPEHHASAIARSVIIKVPQQAKNVGAGTRCIVECQNYSGVMADFIRWLIAGDRVEIFRKRFEELQKRFYGDVAGQQNDIRVATNLAQLGAAFEQFAEYLGDVWADWHEAANVFVENNLIEIRSAMLGEAKQQQASEVFLGTLAELIRLRRVGIQGSNQYSSEHTPIVGRSVVPRFVAGPVLTAGPNPDRFEISTSLALAEVNKCLRQQGRPDLKITGSALLQQLCEDGKLLDQNGEPLTKGSELTHRARLEDGRQQRVFTISRRELLGT